MHGFDDVAPPADASPATGPWYTEMTRYHWFVMVVAALGWLFDCLDQQLFVLARPAAMKDLLPQLDDPKQFEELVKVYGNYATAIFLVGWASGGLIFGVLGDRIGRAKTMMMTILMYSACTGLSALSRGFWDFAAYRFLTGLGVGGEFAVGVALVAEVMPARARPYTLALLQALSAFGNISAALINIGFGIAEEKGLVNSPWRWMFVIGAVPALLALVIRRRLKEPERWQKVSHTGDVALQLGSYRELFRNPHWKKHALLGLVLACSGVIGLWGVGFFTPDLTRSVLRKGIAKEVYGELIAGARKAEDKPLELQMTDALKFEIDPPKGQAMPEELAAAKAKATPIMNGRLSLLAGATSMMINLGAFFGMFGFGAVAQRIGRKPTFAIAFIAAFATTAAVFGYLSEISQIFWMVPIMGFCQLSLFAGYAIYFPELFPTHLRSTGTSFCYNVGRFVAASGPLIGARLIKLFADSEESLRGTGVTMCGVFLVGLLVLPFLPETRGKPLPE
ncbi:MAG TPA: MFS transporter [Planctomycetaceae bacterium]|jgi:MFS family permease